MDRHNLALAGFTRPMSAAARVAAMKARMNPSPMKGKGGEYSMATLDNLSVSIQRWLKQLDELPDPTVARTKAIEQEEDSGEERVHKAPTPAREQDKASVKDVQMADAPPLVPNANHVPASQQKLVEVADSDANSTERIRPVTPPNLPLDAGQHSGNLDNAHASSQAPMSPPARKFEEMDIKSPKIQQQHMTLPAPDNNPANIKDSPTEPPTSNTRSSNYAAIPTRLPLHTNLSTVAIPPTLMSESGDKAASIPQRDLAGADTPQILPSQPEQQTTVPKHTAAPPEGATSIVDIPTTPRGRSPSSASTTKKPKLSSSGSQRTILDSLLAKKARNIVWYDGSTQKQFHDFVLEMSQQIQSIKRERRLVIFAKDPACASLLDKLDTTLQETLKLIETSSFQWLKGRPDLKEMKNLAGRLNDAEEWIREFRKLGWTMSGDSESEEEDEKEEEEEDDRSSDDAPGKDL